MLCLGYTGFGIGRLLLLRAPVGRAGEPALGWAQCPPDPDIQAYSGCRWLTLVIPSHLSVRGDEPSTGA